VQIDVGVGPVVQRVAGEVRWDVHVELCVAVAGVAAQKVASAADLESWPFSWLAHDGVGREAEPQRDRFAGDQWVLGCSDRSRSRWRCCGHRSAVSRNWPTSYSTPLRLTAATYPDRPRPSSGSLGESPPAPWPDQLARSPPPTMHQSTGGAAGPAPAPHARVRSLLPGPASDRRGVRGEPPIRCA
jgi:hypothetical protein